MTEEEIKENYAKGIKYLQSLELLVKEQKTDFGTHAERISMLQFLAGRLTELQQKELAELASTSSKTPDESLKPL